MAHPGSSKHHTVVCLRGTLFLSHRGVHNHCPAWALPRMGALNLNSRYDPTAESVALFWGNFRRHALNLM